MLQHKNAHVCPHSGDKEPTVDLFLPFNPGVPSHGEKRRICDHRPITELSYPGSPTSNGISDGCPGTGYKSLLKMHKPT